MKLYIIIVLGFLVTLTISDCFGTASPSKENCNKAQLSDYEKTSLSAKYCCYQETNGNSACIPYTQEMYDAIGKAKKSELPTIECYSSYLKLGFLGIILFNLL